LLDTETGDESGLSFNDDFFSRVSRPYLFYLLWGELGGITPNDFRRSSKRREVVNRDWHIWFRETNSLFSVAGAYVAHKEFLVDFVGGLVGFDCNRGFKAGRGNSI